MPEAQVADDHAAFSNDWLAGRTDDSTRFEKRRLDAAAGAVSVGADLVGDCCGGVGAEPDFWCS